MQALGSNDTVGIYHCFELGLTSDGLYLDVWHFSIIRVCFFNNITGEVN